MRISENLKSIIVEPRKELDAHLAEVETTAQLVSSAVVLRPRLGKMLNWELLGNYERRLANDFIKHHDGTIGTILVSLFVICYGLLENFIIELVERTILAINSECNDIEKIPRGIRDENILRTGQVLQTVNKEKSKPEYDFVELAQALGSCREKSSNFSLNATCFSFAHGVVSPYNIDKLLSRVGVILNWDKFGANVEIQSVLGNKRTRDCAKSLRSEVETLVRIRNDIAHTGKLDIDVGMNELLKYTKLLPPFCDVLVDEVGKQIDKSVG